jgi:hypothetical protein
MFELVETRVKAWAGIDRTRKAIATIAFIA